MKTQDAFLLSLQPEQSQAIRRIATGALIVGLGLSYWLGTFEFLLPEPILEKIRDDMNVTMRIEPNKPKAVEQKTTPKPTRQQHAASGSRARPKGLPHVPRAAVRLDVLMSRTSAMNHSAYELFRNSNVNKDIAKVLRNNPQLTRNGPTTLGAPRGRVDGSFNAGFGEGGTNGLADALDNIFGTPAPMLGTKTIVGKLAPPRMSEITIGDAGAGRSAAEIMQVVKARTPGLRHIYNKFLKTNEGLAGKVTLKFTILPGGEIVQCEIVDQSTGSGDFADEIRKAVSRWTFKAIAAGNTTVSVPFAFSE